MASQRLDLALDGGRALPSAGEIAVFRPRAGDDLSAFPRGRTVLIQGFRPDHDALAAAGWTVRPTADGRFAAAVIRVPRARAEARALVAAAAALLPEGAPVWVDGQKTDGIDALIRELRDRVAPGEAVAKAHGKCVRFDNPGAAVFADWVPAATDAMPGFRAPPGSFSADGADPGSVLLAQALPQGLKGRVADLGAGWGWLSAAVLGHAAVTEVHLIEAEHAALEAARANVADPRAQFHWADATVFAPARRFDHVVMNPPFHASRQADPALGTAFIRAAARMLAPHGTLWMVANRQLPYERTLSAAFGEVAEIGGDTRFKIVRAARPKSRPAA